MGFARISSLQVVRLLKQMTEARKNMVGVAIGLYQQIMKRSCVHEVQNNELMRVATYKSLFYIYLYIVNLIKMTGISHPLLNYYHKLPVSMSEA